MKLKSFFIPSIIAIATLSGVVHAADSGEVNFLGAVTAKTCDIETSVAGAVNNVVQLGSVVAGGAIPGQEIEFSLKIKDANACDLTQAPAAFVRWAGPSLNATGLSNVNGTATDATITLTAVNAKTANTAVNSSASETEFESATIKADGFKFKAQLTGGNIKGSVDTSAAFAIRYQ